MHATRNDFTEILCICCYCFSSLGWMHFLHRVFTEMYHLQRRRWSEAIKFLIIQIHLEMLHFVLIERDRTLGKIHSRRCRGLSAKLSWLHTFEDEQWQKEPTSLAVFLFLLHFINIKNSISKTRKKTISENWCKLPLAFCPRLWGVSFGVLMVIFLLWS